MEIVAERLGFGYPGHRVIDALDARFLPGRLSGIIGPNGSGKTTLIRLMSGALKPDSGRVLLDDQPVGELRGQALARKIAVVPQKSHLGFDFSVLDVVLMGRQPYIGRFSREKSEDLELAREAMRMTGVEHLEKRSVTALSGGEWQRVIIARALCQATPVMLMDEPISSLDIRHQLEVLNLARRLAHEKQVCVVCVLHDLNLAANFCDELLLMKAGKKVAQGRPEQVLVRDTLRSVYGIEAGILRDELGMTVRPNYAESEWNVTKIFPNAQI